MITDVELVSIRETLVASLPDLADIAHPVATSDGRGGQTITWTTVPDVPVRVAPDTTRAEGLVADRVTAVQRWMLTFPSGTVVRTDARITVGTRTFNAVDVRSARSYEVSCRVVCVEVV